MPSIFRQIYTFLGSSLVDQLIIGVFKAAVLGNEDVLAF